MLLNTEDKKIIKDDVEMNYVSFGNGNKTLIIIPGLGDAIKTVKGLSIPYSIMYKEYTKDYKVYLISRRNNIKEGFSISDMAKDIVTVMDELKISKADIIGISQGGMIAESLAINYKNRVNKLVLAVTASRPNKIMNRVVKSWIDKAKEKDFKTIIIDTAEKSYTDDNLNKYRRLYKTLYNIGRPKDYKRFIIQATACLNHNVYDYLDQIEAETLVIGGRLDKILGVQASIEMHEKIKNSRLYIYEKYGHGVYEHAKDFNHRILDFLNEEVI